MATGNVPYITLEKVDGVCNTVEPERIPGLKGNFLVVAENVDIDDEKMVHRTVGFETNVITGNTQAIWTNGDVFLCVQSNTLKKIVESNGTYSTVILLSDFREPYSFDSHRGTVYFSSIDIIGFLQDGIAYPFPAVTQTFKKKMTGGQLLEVWKNRLFTAQSSKVLFSDPSALKQADKRKYFMKFNGYVGMIKGITDGMYVNAGKYIYWLAGKNVDELSLKLVNDSGILIGSAVKINGYKIRSDILGTVVAWASPDGIYIGFPEGIVKQVTNGNYTINDMDKVSAIYRYDLGYYQYLIVGRRRLTENDMGNKFEISIPMTEINVLGDEN